MAIVETKALANADAVSVASFQADQGNQEEKYYLITDGYLHTDMEMTMYEIDCVREMYPGLRVDYVSVSEMQEEFARPEPTEAELEAMFQELELERTKTRPAALEPVLLPEDEDTRKYAGLIP